MSIRRLDPESAAKIAAGEVVERPASVAKELIENAIDAGATDVRIELRDGGSSLLRVSDNGRGIPAEELSLAFARHATSKITSADDLQTVATLGFRGEALASIAAVSQVTLASRASGAAAGAQMLVHGGQILEQGPAGCPGGTTVTVRNLFFNTPARLKFLRSALAEGGQATRMVGQFALAYPGIGFTLMVDGRTVFQSSGNGDLLDAIARLYGADVAQAMLPVELCEGLQVRGFVSDPELSRSSRIYISIFVNGRLVQSRPLVHAVEEAYSSLLMVGRHPLAALNINLDPSQIDVNVHPTKAEVKFAAERQVFARVREAVQRGVSSWVAPRAVPPLDGGAFARSSWSGPARLRPSVDEQEAAGAWAAAPSGSAPRDPSGEFEAGWENSNRAESRAFLGLSMLRVLGQVGLTYIVAEGPGGLYLIDQHAAHERVRLDELQRGGFNDTGQVPDAQLLLEPLTVEVSPAQLAHAEAARPALSRLGFQLEPFGDRTFLLRSIPSYIPAGEARATVLALLEELADAGPEESEDRLMHSLACHSAVRAGQKLSQEEMAALLAQLERCVQPQACAHGRPTMVHLSQAQLEREFGRR